jgi:O-methyltransferase
MNPEDRYREIFKRVQPFTMTSYERIRALVESVEYVVRNQISGSVVECGVWKGGSMMAAALALLEMGESDRQLFLYDTFTGMSKPTDMDVSFSGESAEQTYSKQQSTGEGWCEASLSEVRHNLLSTGYPEEKMTFVQGSVEETLRKTIPDRIAILRLDTDWYESTQCELEVLYPRLSSHGVLIVDDYGHWQGARQAVDEYFGQKIFKPFLHRIDYTGRVLIRPASIQDDFLQLIKRVRVRPKRRS